MDIPAEVDLLVIGGGINGAGIARDAAGRGLSVLLCERDDLASHTSSWSTKLIHGGLRYLEHYEFRLVRESLIEREVLLRAAPHLVRPMRFILPHSKEQRPAWLVRLGLFLYDNIGGRRLLPSTKSLDLSSDPAGEPLKEGFSRGFEYSDCAVDDARLVVANAVDAKERGAAVLTGTEVIGGERQDGAWVMTLETEEGGYRTVRARAVVNAAGPWVTDIFSGLGEVVPRKKVRLVKGSHIVVTGRFGHGRAYLFQNTDKRIIFAIPYLHGSTLIGTTDVPFGGDPVTADISEEETDYLLAAVNRYFRQPVGRGDIVASYSGVRPLYDDLSREDVSTVTRDYAFDIDAEGGGAPLLSVYGGKLTTYRKLAEHALEELAPSLGDVGRPWTAGASLPGGEIAYEGWDGFRAEMGRRYPFLPQGTAERLIACYGTRLPRVLGDASSMDDLGPMLLGDLSAREADYLRREEFARTEEDMLFRRTKVGLRLEEAARHTMAGPRRDSAREAR